MVFHCDSSILYAPICTFIGRVVPCPVMDPKLPIRDAFKIADDVLRQGVKGISEIITVGVAAVSKINISNNHIYNISG